MCAASGTFSGPAGRLALSVLYVGAGADTQRAGFGDGYMEQIKSEIWKRQE